MNQASVENPSEVFALNLSKCELEFIIEEDLELFSNLQTLDVSENALPFAKLGHLPSLKKLNFSCNGLKSLDLEVDGRYLTLESLDLSFNKIDRAGLIVLARLPNLKQLDLTKNNIKTLSTELCDMTHWKENVITLILPFQVAALGLNVQNEHDSPSLKHVDVLEFAPSLIINPDQVGFQHLESLIFDRNPIGSTQTESFWTTLSHLPRYIISQI